MNFWFPGTLAETFCLRSHSGSIPYFLGPEDKLKDKSAVPREQWDVSNHWNCIFGYTVTTTLCFSIWCLYKMKGHLIFAERFTVVYADLGLRKERSRYLLLRDSLAFKCKTQGSIVRTRLGRMSLKCMNTWMIWCDTYTHFNISLWS